MSFAELGLASAILRALDEQHFTLPTPIQAQAIPPALKGRDLMGAAQTGSGKTASFVLPILARLGGGQPVRANQVRALILTPTRELAAQVHEQVLLWKKYLPLKSACVFGGVKINPQMMALRGGVDVLVATPGRLLDLHQQNAVRFNSLEILVLDEADRMLDMGFIRDIRKILALLPAKRQTLLFSATFSNDIRELAKGLLQQPLEIDVTPPTRTAETVEHKLHPVDKARKAALLIHLIQSQHWQQALVFTRTKHGANKLVTQLEKAGINAAAIHGNKSQNHRTRVLADFKQGKLQILVATDIAARGIDIDQLPQVVNFELPNVPEDYVHRIGRTGRAGASGHAISLVCAEESKPLRDIERVLGQPIARETLAGFEPVEPLGSSSVSRPARPPRQHTQPAANHGNRQPRAPQGDNRPSRTSSNGNRQQAGQPPAGNQARPGQRRRSRRPAGQNGTAHHH